MLFLIADWVRMGTVLLTAAVTIKHAVIVMDIMGVSVSFALIYVTVRIIDGVIWGVINIVIAAITLINKIQNFALLNVMKPMRKACINGLFVRQRKIVSAKNGQCGVKPSANIMKSSVF